MTKLEKLYSIIENSRDALWPDGRGRVEEFLEKHSV